MAANPPAAFDVFPENWLPLRVFLAMETQWRTNPRGQMTGLDYTALAAVREGLAIAPEAWPPLFADLQLMEDEALAAYWEQAGAEP
jgi:hypothetical protein